MPALAPLNLAHVDAESGFSGGEVQVFHLMEGLRARGHTNALIAPPGSRAEEEATRRGFASHPVRMANDLDLSSVVVLKRELEKIAPDLVHLHTGRATWLGGLAARLADLPAITTRRMDRAVKRNWRTRLVYGSLVRRAVAISASVQTSLVEGGVPPERTVVIASSVDPRDLVPKIARAVTRRALEVGDDVTLLLSLASLVPRKGLDVLLDALELVDREERMKRPFALWIAGDGPEREALEERVARSKLADRVRFLGRRADAADLLAACDVFVLPARREGLGVAALEAMAAGRAVVATRVGGLAESVVDGVTGLLVPPDDAPSLARALERLIADPALRDSLARQGPARVAERFHTDRMVENYEALYRAVLAEDARA